MEYNNTSSDNLLNDDVPSPIDLRRMDDAALWAKESNIKRPFRYDFFDGIATVIKNLNATDTRVLELGAGPGFLAEYLLSKMPNLSYDLFDFSPAMHQLSSQRLALWKNKCNWLTGDFKRNGWSTLLEQYDVVVTMQAVHELRHKRYATEFHKSVLKLLSTNTCLPFRQGTYLMCDHYVGEDGMSDQALYMTPSEHMESLNAAGFGTVKIILKKSGLILFNAGIAEQPTSVQIKAG